MVAGKRPRGDGGALLGHNDGGEVFRQAPVGVDSGESQGLQASEMPADGRVLQG